MALRSVLALAATAAGLSGAAAFQQIPNPAQTVLLTDYVNKTGARCLDGSPQRYWIQTAAPGSVNASKWYIHIMGGGWCESEEACAGRAYAWYCYIGSSNPACFSRTPGSNELPGVLFNTTMDLGQIPSVFAARWGGGLIVNDPRTNEMSYDWNKVELSYCDGGSFTGNNESVSYVSFNGTNNLPLYYRGQRNWDAVIDDLKTRWGLDVATEVILGGDSAGGLATYHHLDKLADALPGARVIGAPDSGYFFRDASYPAWPASLGWVASAMNSTAGLNDACVAGESAAGRDPLDCIFPEVVTPYIRSPMFVINSRFDPALDGISAGENGNNITNVNRIGTELLALVNKTVLTARPPFHRLSEGGGEEVQAATNAAFITSCHQHCGQWAQGQGQPVPDYNVTIDGYTAVPALEEWLSSLPSFTWPVGSEGRARAEAAEALQLQLASGTRLAGQEESAVRTTSARRLWVQEALYPCANCCNGGQS